MADASIRLAVEGGSSFKQAMQAAESSVKLFNTELKNLAQGMASASGSDAAIQNKVKLLGGASEAAKQKVALLTAEQQKQIQKLNELKKALDDANKEQGESSVEAEKAANAVNKQVKVVNDLGIKLSKAQAEADKFGSELKELTNSADSGGNKLNLFGEKAKKLGDDLEDAGNKALSFKDVLGANIFSGLIQQGLQLAVNELRQFVQEIINVGSEYEAQMAKVSAISGAYKDTTGQTASRLGALTQELSGYFTQLEVAQALEYEAMAGWDTTQIESATQAILNLAQAGGIDLARASEIATTGLTAFGMSVEDADRFADVLAVTASSAATDIDAMGETFKNVAPLAGAMGYSIEDMSVAIGLMANNGIKGAQAGTQLRSIMSRLAAPTAEVEQAMAELGVTLSDETTGELLSFEDVVSQLRRGFGNLETDVDKARIATELAGKQGMSGLLAIVNSTAQDVDKLTIAINNSAGAAQEMADVMGDTYEGDVRRAQTATQNLQKEIFNLFEGPLRKAKQGFADFANGLANAIKNGSPLVKVIKDIGEGLVAFGVALVGVKIAGFIASMGGLLGMVEALKAAFIALNASLGVFGMVALAITATVTAIKIYSDTVGDAANASDVLTSRIKDNAAAAKEAAEAEIKNYEEINQRREERIAGDMAQMEATERLADELLNLADSDGRVADADRDRANFLIGELNGALGTELELVDGLIKGQEDLTSAIQAAIDKKKAQLLLEAEEESYLNALEKRSGAVDAAVESEKQLEIAHKNVLEIEKQLAEEQRLFQEELMESPSEYNSHTQAVNDLSSALEAAKDAENEARTAHELNLQTVSESTNEIIKYEDALAAAADGDFGRIEELLVSAGDGFVTLKDVAGKSLQEQEFELKTQLENMERAYDITYNAIEDKESEHGQKMIAEAQKLVDDARVEYEKLGTETVDAYAGGVDGESDKAKTAVENMVSNTGDSKNIASAAGAEIGQALVGGVSLAIQSRAGEWATMISTKLLAAKDAGKRAIDAHSPAKLFVREIGIPIAQGIAVGIEQGAEAVECAIVALLSGAELQAGSSGLEFVNLARSTADRVTDAIQKEIEKQEATLNFWDNYFDIEAESETVLNNANKLQELYGKLGEAEAKEREKILKDIQKLEDDYNKKQVQAQMKAEQSAVKERAKFWEDLKKDFEKQIEDIEKKEESLANKISGYGELFAKVQTEAGEMLKINNLDEDIRKIEEYGDALNKLQDKGVSKEFLSEITSLNIDDATAYMDELLKMTDKDFDAYMDKWQEKQDLSKEIAKEFYSDEMEDVSREMLNTMQDFKNEFDATGEYLMQGVAQGILDGKSEVINAAVQAVQEAQAAANAAMGINSPSTEMAKTGKYMAQGLGVGWLEEMRNVNRDIRDGLASTADMVTGSGIMQATEAAVNGINAGQLMSNGNGQPVYISLILDGKQIAQAVYDPLKQVRKQRGR